MIEETINDLIAKMVDLGFEYDQESCGGVYFNLTDGTDGFLCLADWDEVESFVANHTNKED